jgi:hypothetical protein
MSENLLKDEFHPIESVSGASVRAYRLFREIEKHHGTEEARRIFRAWSKAPSKKQINEIKAWRILDRFDAMQPQNVAELARQLVSENETLPEEDRLTPRGKPTLPTVDKYIRLLLKKREDKLVAGTWIGPGRPWPETPFA